MSTAFHRTNFMKLEGTIAQSLVGKNIDINECRKYNGFDTDICGIVDVKSETEQENKIVDIEDPIKYPVMSHNRRSQCKQMYIYLTFWISQYILEWWTSLEGKVEKNQDKRSVSNAD